MNTYWAVIIPALFTTFGIFLMRQYMHGIPDELIDAALMMIQQSYPGAKWV
jgi:multiple sugar transport system permease protein